MKNPLFFLLKKINWPKKLMISAIFLTLLASFVGLTIPLLTKKIVDLNLIYTSS